MVAMTLFFRRRQAEDLNNFNYITDVDPVNPFVFPPLYRDHNHPDFLPNSYEFKAPATNDDKGLYTTFLINPARKLRQNKIQVTIEQKSNVFKTPLFFVGLFGFRPGLYDPNTQAFQPFYDSYFLDRNVNLMCDNTSLELKSADSASMAQELIGLGVVPDSILNAVGGGTYKEHPFHDSTLVTVFQTTNTVVANNKVYTTHDLVTPLLNTLPDVSSLGPGVALEAKLNVYLAYTDYTLGTESKMRLINADEVVSLGGDFDVI